MTLRKQQKLNSSASKNKNDDNEDDSMDSEGSEDDDNDDVESTDSDMSEDDSDDEPNENDVIVPGNGMEEINVEFEAFPPSDQDYQGLKALLGRLFNNDSDINLHEMVNWVLSHNYVGSVLKASASDTSSSNCDEEDDDEENTVYGITTVISLKPTGNEDSFKKQILQFLTKHCQHSDLHSILNNPKNSIGLLLTERFVNIPPLLAPPMLKCLTNEIAVAVKKKLPYNFTHYLLISKTCAVEQDPSLPPEMDFLNPEEQLFMQCADVAASFHLTGSDEIIAGNWGANDKPLQQFRTVSLLTKNNFHTAVSKIAEVYTLENLMNSQ